MRIGTWNLAGHWDGRYEHLMQQQNCDVWLLTEVNESLAVNGCDIHSTAGYMAKGRKWAAILSREPLVGRPDPHSASALAGLGNLLLCSSILPWRSCKNRLPWVGARHADKTRVTIDELLKNLPQGRLVWGGDWNHALSGRELAGSQEGRRYVSGAVDRLGLQVPTAALPHRLPELGTIDHIAVSQAATVQAAYRVEAAKGGQRLSDHDAYVVEVSLP